MKKYPVTYKGETYEVRWETSGIFDYIVLYKVNEKKKHFGRYKQIYSFNLCGWTSDNIKNYLNITDEDYEPELEYVYQVKFLFKYFERKVAEEAERLKFQQQQNLALELWNGKIE